MMTLQLNLDDGPPSLRSCILSPRSCVQKALRSDREARSSACQSHKHREKESELKIGGSDG